MNRILPGIAAAILLSGAAHAAGQVTVKNAWIRALPGNLPAGGYFTLQNDGKKALTLTGVSSPNCGEVMLHESRDEGGRKTMAHVHELNLPAGGSLVFAPGGYHIMCMKPKNLTIGGTADVTFLFKDGSKQNAKFAVRNAKGQ